MSSSKQTDSSSGVLIAEVRLSNPDKVLYPDQGTTKLDLAQYYESVANWIMPHIENRLLSLVRCPAGRSKKCFFQKHPGSGELDHLKQLRVQEQQASATYLALDNLAGLISLVQMGVLEIHAWGCQIDRLERPDRLILDLDPDASVAWSEVVAAAREVHELLESIDLVAFLKTTGGKGLHIVIPIRRRHSWDEAISFCHAVAAALVRANPRRYTANMSKASRKEKIFVDYLRNDRGATTIIPYSTRAKPGAPVSVPLAWHELSATLTSDHYHMTNVRTRLAHLKQDPWREITSSPQSLTVARMKKVQEHARE